jgi:alkylresorcinol/alkylpyrone synthase
MRPSIQLLSLVTHVPSTTLTQEDTLAALPRLAGGAAPAERFRSTVERSFIERRYVETPLVALERMGPGARARLYEQRLRVIAEDLGRRVLAAGDLDASDVSCVVTVSCTGYMLPSADAYVMPRLGINAHARRIPITQLGCSAGVGAIGLAADLLRVHRGHALITSIELCSSCLQTRDLVPSDVIGNILFGDAGAAVLIGPSMARVGPEILASGTVLWPGTTDALGMRLTDTGLRLVLAPDLPEIVGERLEPTVTQFLAANSVGRTEIRFWAIHPGGPRVLDAVAQGLHLADHELSPSWEVWRNYGNVSSATVFFILDVLRSHPSVATSDLGLMIAFGPGLSCELTLLRAGGWLGKR